MKKILLATFVLYLLTGCTRNDHDTNSPGCGFTGVTNKFFPKKQELENILQEYVGLGIPAAVVAIYSPSEGYWAGARGFSKIETKSPMDICHLQYLQSISKTYMATAILKLVEEGRINLDAPITSYLPLKYSRYIDKAETVKVRNLMNHTSGVPEYTDVPEYISYLLQHPDHSFTTEEFLEYIKNEKQRFTPGSRFAYTNTNYHLLALIGDAVAGDHAQLIRQKVFAPAGLTHTFYRGDPGYLNYPALPDSYLDLEGNGNVRNVTEMQRVSVACSKGDDGMVTTPFDALKFLQALMQNKLLKPASLQQMKTWVNDDEGQPIYGLGLYHVKHKGIVGYGHGGAGIGAGSGLYYFPEKDLYIFLATNIGTLVDGPIVRRVDELKTKILDVALSE